MLHGVDEGDRLRHVTKDVLQRVVGLPGNAVAGPGNLADAVGEHAAGLGGIEVAVGVLDIALALPDAGDLRDLLLQGHAREEVIDPRRDRRLRILVDRLVGGAGRRDDACRRQCEDAGGRERAGESVD